MAHYYSLLHFKVRQGSQVDAVNYWLCNTNKGVACFWFSGFMLIQLLLRN